MTAPLHEMLHDIRLAFRAFRDHVGFALAALVTLALGIGATTATFSVMYGVLLRPLPYAEAGRLVRLSEFHPGATAAMPGAWLSNLTYYAWQRERTTIGPIATYGNSTATVAFDVPARMEVARVSPELFDVLRVLPALGRFFLPEDVADGATPVVVLSHTLWRDQFGSDPGVLTRTLTIDDRAHLIVGVAPAGFAFPTPEVRFWTASAMARSETNAQKPRVNVTGAIARLQGGATPEQAAAEGTARARSVPRPFAAEMLFGKGGPVEVRAQPLADYLTAGIRPALLVLFAGVGCLLLIACANVANLFLSRGVSRERELAVRVALGARRGRLMRQLLTESLAISCVGGVVGMVLAWSLMRAPPAVVPQHFPRLDAVSLDWRALLFAILMSLAAGALSGLMPALRGARPDLLPALREGIGASAGKRTTRFRHALLVGEAALAVMLLVGAALLARSFIRLIQTDPGYDRSNVLTARIYLPGASAGRAHSDAFIMDLLPRVRALPSVIAAGAGNMAPLGESTFVHGFTLQTPGREPVMARGLAYWVTPGYGEALGLRLRAGRLLAEADLTSPLQSMVVNEEFTRTFLSGLQPVGLQFPSLLTGGATAEIVGVIKNVLKDGLDTAPQPEVYIPAPAHKYSITREINLMVRTTTDPLVHADTLRHLVRDLQPAAAVDDITTLESQVSASVGQPRFAATLLAGFALIALVLAAVGLYGVLSYTVSRRRREMGVRTALGATRATIILLVVREGMTVATAGLVLGLAGAAGVTRLMQRMLFGVEPLDTLSFVTAPVLLLVVALAACVIPARRAAKTDPALALRSE